MEYQCKQCGKTFTPKHSKYHTFCEYKCFTDYRNSNSKVPIVPCPMCGKEFKQTASGRGKKKYCSHKCQWESLKKHEVKKCPQCGKEFYPGKERQMCCSVSCSIEMNRKYSNEAEQRKAYSKTYNKKILR